MVFEEDLQNDLLRYAMTTMLFSDKMVDSTLISWNRVILLHGVNLSITFSHLELEKHHFVKV